MQMKRIGKMRKAERMIDRLMRNWYARFRELGEKAADFVHYLRTRDILKDRGE